MKNFSKVFSAQTTLLKAQIVDIEVDLSRGLHSFSIVGLPDKAVEESRDRVSAAIKNSGFKSPKNKNQKVVVSLAPADLKKEGPLFDLGIALGYLLAAGDISFNPKKKLFLGELSLDGDIRRVGGVLPLAMEAKKRGFEELYVPADNAAEAALIDDIAVYAVRTLREIVEHLSPGETERPLAREMRTPITYTNLELAVDFADVKGQETVKRGLEIAAAGGHNVAMSGPPGTGKTMLARAFAGLMPPLTFEEILETTSIHSVGGHLRGDLITQPPFRAPHHTSSYVSLIGGGVFPKPGEVTLAHKGVLFLDEFPEFERRVIETLRQPLEERVVSISRAKGSAEFPADFILIAAMNPCPCGNFNIKGKDCRCTPIEIARYQKKISGPIIDRIDLWLEVGQIDHEKLARKDRGEPTAAIQERVHAARERQAQRFFKHKRGIKRNSQMNARDIEHLIELNQETQEALTAAAKKLDLSARAYHRVIKLARTIADLEGDAHVKLPHLLEALQYRPKLGSSY